MLTLLLVEHALKMSRVSGHFWANQGLCEKCEELQLCYIEINIMVNTIHPMEVSTVLGRKYAWEENTDQGADSQDLYGEDI